MAVPYTFGTATASIPLSQLDSNFATAITLGNTAVYLGNTTTSIGNLTLTNVTISSGSVSITDTSISGNVTLSGGTANGVAYLNASKVLTTGTALVFDGTNLGVGTSSPSSKLQVSGAIRTTGSDSTAVASSGVMRYIAGTTMGFVSYGANTSTPGAFNFTGLSSDASAGDVRATIDSAGNLGLGVTPSAWTTFKVMQLGSVMALGGVNGSSSNVFANTYYDGAYKYIGTGAAYRYEQNISTGYHAWWTAPSGTAGNTITFTQAMTLDASGNLVVGGTSAVYTNSNRGNISINGASTALLALSTAGTGRAYLYTDGSRLDLLNTQNDALTFGTNNAERARIDSSGNLIQSAPTTPPSLATNGTMVFNLTSNTNLRVSVRGTDGVTRTANITLA